jgi:peptide chain release factor 3
VGETIGNRRWETLRDEVELLGAGREFDLEALRAGTLSPVFFGSALTNFGVEPFLEGFLRLTTPPQNRMADGGVVDAFGEDFSAFVFKIQANMNKAHRDRLAFLRICSGKFQRDAEVYHMQSGKKMRLSQPQTMMAAEREIVEEAYAGDIIGVFDPGIFSIGDTITVPGKKFHFMGIPTFEPEHFMRVSPKDTMKRKQFIKGTEQIAQEGAIQIFKVPGGGMEEVIVGVVGTLQFDVFEYRMKNEYGVDLYMSGLPYEHLRRIAACPVDNPKDLTLCMGAEVLEDFKGRHLIAFGGEWSVGFLTKHNPGLELSESISV